MATYRASLAEAHGGYENRSPADIHGKSSLQNCADRIVGQYGVGLPASTRQRACDAGAEGSRLK